MKKIWSVVLALVMLLSLMPMGAFTLTANAETSGEYAYTVSDGKATITGYNGSATSLNIPATLDGYPVTSIGDYAFCDCTSLTSITIPDSVTSIGSYAFSYCYSLTSITIPNSVTSIECGTFSHCGSLTSIIIPDSVTSIGEEVFANCTNLTSISVPSSVERVACDAFSSCYNLTMVNISDIAAWCKIEFDNYNSNPLYYSKNLYIDGKLVTALTIPSSVTSIGDYVFDHCNSLSSITIPSSVTSIGNWAFRSCSNLRKLTIPYSVTSVGDWAFYECGNLTSITIPNSLTSIGEGTFASCSSLTSIAIPNSVTSIRERAFSDCTSLTSVTIPNSVTSIDGFVFYNCTSLTSVTIPNSVTSIGSYAFSYCYSLTSITIPNSVTSIECGTFSHCGSLTSITIPDGVSIIHTDTFANCIKLTSITIPNSVKEIFILAFGNTLILKNVYFKGTEADKNNLKIGPGNNNLTAATWHYNSCDGGVTHMYTADCDSSCNVCGNTRTALAHKYDNDCDADCNICDENRSITHSYAAATCTAPKTCKNCGVTSGSKLGHTYTNACDTACNRCNATRTITHAYKTTTTKATTSKNGSIVKKCTVCGKVASNTTIKSPKTFTLSTATYTYDGKVKTPTVTVKDSAGKTISSSNYTVTYASGRKNAGTYKVTVKMKGNYTGTKTLTFKINPINVSKCKLSLSTASYTYNGAVKTPTVTVKNANGTTLTKNTHYTVTYASGRKNVGTYKVTIKGKGNYTGTKTLTFKINPINVSKCSVKLSTTSYTYNGSAKTPTVTVKNANGVKLTKGTHYTVTYASGRKNVGTYKVTIKMKGNYTGTKTLTFKINPINVSKCSVKLSTTSYTYNGSVKTPTVIVKNANGVKLTKGTHYTVTYASGRKNVGTYKVTIKMKGNYTGTKTLTFKINPAQTTVSKATPATKSLKVSITKKATQVTGYQVQYSTSKSFTSAKTKTLTKNTTTSTTLTGLKAKTTYYVRVRTYKTVGSTKYYSGWSTAKSAKTK